MPKDWLYCFGKRLTDWILNNGLYADAIKSSIRKGNLYRQEDLICLKNIAFVNYMDLMYNQEEEEWIVFGAKRVIMQI